MTSITCNKCHQEFEFSEEEMNWFAEMGFKNPKKCKKCKDLQKNKKVYTYTPSQKELELKEKMLAAERSKKVHNRMTNAFGALEEDEPEEQQVRVMKWADNEDEEMDWSKPIKWLK